MECCISGKVQEVDKFLDPTGLPKIIKYKLNCRIGSCCTNRWKVSEKNIVHDNHVADLAAEKAANNVLLCIC